MEKPCKKKYWTNKQKNQQAIVDNYVDILETLWKLEEKKCFPCVSEKYTYISFTFYFILLLF